MQAGVELRVKFDAAFDCVYVLNEIDCVQSGRCQAAWQWNVESNSQAQLALLPGNVPSHQNAIIKQV